MKRNVTILLLSFFLVISSAVHGQLSVMNNLITSMSITTASMFNVTVINSSPNVMQAILQVSLVNSGNEIICTGKTFPFNLQPGVNNISSNKIRIADFSYGNSTQAGYVKTSHTLPSGNFKYCASLVNVSGSESPFEFCKDLESFTMSYLHLVSPSDKEVIATQYPVLIWTHSELFSSLSTGEFFRILVTEMEEGQKPEAAVIANRPVLFKDYIKTHNIPYPSDAPGLVPLKRYAWEVQKISNGVIVDKSEAWEFSLQPPPPPKTHQFYLLSNQPQGYGEAIDNMLYFSFAEQYSGGLPECIIYDAKGKILKPRIKNESNKSEKSVDTRKLGDNRFAVDLTELHLKKGFYTLESINAKREKLTLNFRVK